MEFTVERLSPRRARWSVGNDTIQGNIEQTNKLMLFAAKHGLTPSELVSRALASPPPSTRAAEPTPVVRTEPLRMRVRAIRAPSSDAIDVEGGDPIKAFQDALRFVRDEQSVIYWKGTKNLALLDVDFHGTTPPSRTLALTTLVKLRPVPFVSWVSHGGGLHALYHPQAGLDADEIAAAAALSIRDLLPTAAIEVISVTNHPIPTRTKNGVKQRCSELSWQDQTLDGALRQWMGTEDEDSVDEEEIEDWLDARGMQIDQRYNHTFCPFDPSESGGNDPVLPNEQGVTCFKCYGQGHSSGGFQPWSKLIHGRTISRILSSARALVPWEHARFVIAEDYGRRFSPGLLKRAYFALAKLVHTPEDPRLWRLRKEYGCVRGSGGLWLSSSTLDPIQPKVSEYRLKEMPSVREAWEDEAGEWQERVSGTLLDRHLTNEPIPGWPEVVAVRGSKMWGQYLPYSDPNKVRAQITPEGTKHPARYLPEKRRLSEDDCEEKLLEAFPGICLPYLQLLLVARGFAESGKGMVPIIVSVGPSGSGKTQTAALAATICGDVSTRVPRGNWQESFGYQSKKSGIVILDEFAKGKKGDKLRQAFDFLLEIDRVYAYRRLYVGPTNDPILSAIIVTNNAYGPEVLEHAQVARRVVYVRLPTQPRVDWQVTCGTGDIRRWRDGDGNAEVCDSYLSWIIDRFFSDTIAASEGTLSFFDAAEELGYPRLRDSHDQSVFEGLGVEDQIREFFTAVCALSEPQEGKFKGRGWRALPLDDQENDATKAWKALCDDWSSPSGRLTSTKIDERDLSRVLGVELGGPRETVRFYSTRRGRTLLCKFQHERTRKDYDANEAIKRDS